MYLLVKAVLSGLLIAAASEAARRLPALGALIASLPLVSVVGMMWLWRDRPDAANMAAHSVATFYYVLPSLPMFLVIAHLLDRGWPFPAALASGCALSVVLYAAMVVIGPKLGLPV